MTCPVCEQELEGRDDVFVLDCGDMVAGCCYCLHRHNAAEWYVEQADAYYLEAYGMYDCDD